MGVELLARGRQSTVYMRPAHSGPEVVKVLGIERPTARELLRFHNELQVSAALEVDGVRRAQRKELFQGRHALVLDYVPGEHLRLPAPDQPRELVHRLELAARVADILARLHAAGVVHRDVKPENLLYDPATGRLSLIDLGSASRVAVRTTQLGNPLRLEGTLAYLSPEQTGRMARIVDHRTDLYSFGVMLFELLAGRRPFVSDDPLELIHGHLARVPPRVDALNPVVPGRVGDIVARLLEKNAEDRYGAAELVAEDLRACAAALAAGEEVQAVRLSYDTRATFSVPERLYGREAQSEALRAAAGRAAEGHAELATAAGPSGTGKSHLVRQLQRDLAGRHGLFLAGKFDRLQRDIPYYAALQAFEGLVDQLITYEEAVLSRWRERLSAAVGELGAVVTQVVPRLELVLGPQLPVPELGSQETRARLQYVFRRFVAALCDPDHPVVFFLDDVQWADRASLDLLEDVLIDPAARHLLVVLAYRDDELGPTHPMTGLMARLAEAGVRHTALSVGALSASDLAQLALDTTGHEGERLARLLADKTGGNPFFARQFLRSLHERGLFTRVDGTWVLAEEGLDALDITDNVARLLAANLRALPEPTWQRLCTAACLGHRFDLPTLADVEELPVQQVAEALWPAVSAGYLIAEEDAFRLVHAEADASAYEGAVLSFVHDRVQAAAYQLVDEQARPAVHRRVGEVLRKTRPDAVFDIAHHLNLAADSAAACPDLAGLNLAAGRRATGAAAHDEALHYFEAGLARLAPDAWTADYQLARDLHTEAARAALEADANDKVDALTAPVLAHGRTPLERVPALRARMMAAVAVNDLPRALSIGLDALAELGEPFPARPGGPHIGLALLRVKLALWGTEPEALAERPPMTVPEKREAMWVLEKLLPTAFRIGSEHFPLIVLRLVQLSLAHGNSPVSSFAYAGYAIMLCGILGDFAGGERFGRLALSLSERYPEHANLRSKALFVHSNMVAHWRHPLREGIEDLALASRLGSEAGSTFDAVWSAFYRVMWLFVTGAELAEVAAELDAHAGLLARDESARDEGRLLRQLVANLLDEEAGAPWVLSGEHCEEAEIEAALCGTGDGTDEVIHWLCRGWLALLFGRFEAAVHAFARAEAQFDAVVALPFIPLVETYAAVARCARAAEGDASGLRRAKKSARKLAKWARSCPANYAHRHAWVLAELAAATGRRHEAREAFGRAATLARDGGWSQDEALILERSAGFEHAHGHQVVAEALAERASAVYRAWGAQAKLVRGPLLAGSPQLLTDSTLSTQSTGSGSGVDMQSILKASSAVTSILVLDKLLVRLVEILVENAGATHGAVVLHRDGQWRVEVSLGLSDTPDLEATPLGESTRICRAAVRFAARSGRSLTVADAQVDDRFHTDPRVVEGGVRSMLAVPVIKAGRVTGVVYAENRHVAGAFTTERLAVLELLAAQAAIALDNAHLYENLNASLARQVSLTEAHRRFVPQAFLDNLGAASIADVALGDAVEKDMAVLFSDIRGFTPLIEGLGARASIRFINGYLEFMEPPIHAHGGFVDSYIGDAIMALFEGGTEGAVRAALGMLDGLRALNERRGGEGLDPIHMGIGISYGRVMLGTIGGPNRLKCGVIGDPVNLGARVESLTKAYAAPLLVTDSVLAGLPAARRPAHRLADRVVVKGRNEGVALYEIYAADAPARREAKQRAQPAHEAGVEAFYARGFGEAARAFTAVIGELGEDVIAERYLRRAQALEHMDLPEDWTGVERLSFK